MTKKIPISLFIIIAGLCLAAGCRTAEVVYVIPIKGTIDLGLSSFFERVFEDAKRDNARAVILEIDTFGGRVDAATKIRDIIFDSGVRSIAFVNKRAISAGALIALATKSIVMSPGATIGAATPVQISSSGSASPTSEKEISYVRKEFKATAENGGHPTDLAEAMVDSDVEIKGVVEKGKLLTLTTEEALKLKLAEHKSDSLQGVMAIYGLEGLQVKRVEATWSENLVRFLTNPVVSGILLSMGFLGIFFELRMPGWGVSGTIGAVCLSLFFGGHLLVGLAEWVEIILLFSGVVLLLAEILVIPGFGIAGISGIGLIALSVFMSLVKRPAPEVPVFAGDYINAFYIMGWSFVGTAVALFLAFKFVPSTRAWKRLEPLLVLKSEEKRERGYKSPSLDQAKFMGREGLALTVLRPSGKIMIGEDVVDASSQGEYIEAGEKVRIVRVESNTAVVEKI